MRDLLELLDSSLSLAPIVAALEFGVKARPSVVELSRGIDIVGVVVRLFESFKSGARIVLQEKRFGQPGCSIDDAAEILGVVGMGVCCLELQGQDFGDPARV